MKLRENSDYFLNINNEFIFVMEKCCAFFQVRAEFVNIIYRNITLFINNFETDVVLVGQ
jgi:hypothetical protein